MRCLCMPGLAAAVMTIVCVAGCGPELPEGLDAVYPVEVTVTHKGQPLDQADIYFIPDDGEQRFAAVGTTDAAGKATLYTLNKYEGAKAGTHKVSVAKWEVFDTGRVAKTDDGEEYAVTDRKLATPEKYRDHNTSGITQTVEKGSNSFTIELTDE